MRTVGSRRHGVIKLLLGFTATAGLAALSCTPQEPEQPEPGGVTGQPEISFVSPLADRNLASGNLLTITYSISNSPTSALAFLDPDLDPNDDNERVFAEGIAGGTNQRINLDTSEIPRGVYYYAIRASNSMGTVTTYARDADSRLVQIQINDLPQLAIAAPSGPRHVSPGGTLEVVFSCNDPENDVSWSVFFDTNLTVDGGETVLPNGVGEGNAPAGATQQTVTWATVGVPEGTYFIGVNCIDSADSQVQEYAAGAVTVSSAVSIPTVTVLTPAEDVTVFADDSFVVEFSISEPDATAPRVSIFVDRDDQLEDDESEIVLASRLPPQVTSFAIDPSILAAIPDDRYFVGAFLEQDGERNVDYAPGRLNVVGVGALTILAPDEPVAVRPGDEVSIIWSTNVPVGMGLISLRLLTSDSEGAPGAPVVPDPLEQAKNLPISPNSAALDTRTLASGFYVAEVTLTPTDANGSPSGDPPSTALTPYIRVTTAADVFWLGRIEVPAGTEPPTGHFDGVIFEGVNFQDNAGSSVVSVPPLPDASRQEAQALALLDPSEPARVTTEGGFVIGARFAKPLFQNPNGIGMGEAYMIYNEFLPDRNRRYSLNGVGAKHTMSDEAPDRLPGLRIAGIAFDPRPEDIMNLDPTNPTIDVLTEDRDGDGQLSFINEDVNGNEVLDPFEDRDADGLYDVEEDGRVGIDADGDGVVDAGSPPVTPAMFAPDGNGILGQFINGALDVGVSEDRDGDGVLENVGDATWGLSAMAMFPDPCNNGYPVLVLGFESTDSLTADYRRFILNDTEDMDFGSISQENQFERGGLVMIPSDPRTFLNGDQGTLGQVCNEPSGLPVDLVNDLAYPRSDNKNIGDPSFLRPFNLAGTRDEDRVIQADFVGQGFRVTPADPDPLLKDPNGCGLVGFLARLPRSGSDSPPFTTDSMAAVQNPDCEPGEVEIVFANLANEDLIANARFTVISGGDQEPVALAIGPEEIGSICAGDCGAGDVEIFLDGVDFFDFDAFGGVIPAGGAPGFDEDGDGMLDAVTPPCLEDERVGFTVSNGTGEARTSLVCDSEAECDDLDFAATFEACVPAADDCLESLAGPFFGFMHGADTHPLAYRRTLANPGEMTGIPITQENSQADQLAVLSVFCENCGRTLVDSDSIRTGSCPPQDVMGTGFCAGEALEPIGARVLGRAAGDRFAASLSASAGIDGRALVGAPGRSASENPATGQVEFKEGAGAVHQFKMAVFWDSASDLGFINESDVPKPHQYIVEDIGSHSPDGARKDKRKAIRDEHFEYQGSDAGDHLGTAVLGISDFNMDGQPDILMGAPGADGKANDRPDSGAVYLVYRISIDIDSVSLRKIELPLQDPNRLNGLLINGDHNPTDGGDGIGAVLASNCDLNGDDITDFVIGSPAAGSTNAGEVIVVLGGPNLSSPENGFTIQEVVDRGRAVRIQGARAGDLAGFNVTCDGDFNGDDLDDLVIAAPGATPMYDSNGDDVPDMAGLDLDRDGQNDGLLTDPQQAGLVYVVTNVNELTGTLSLSQMGGVIRGFTFVGLNGGDFLGGGVESKRNTSSRGLGYVSDVDGDGKDDLIVGSILADPPGKVNAGEAYLIFGFDERQAESIINP